MATPQQTGIQRPHDLRAASCSPGRRAWRVAGLPHVVTVSALLISGVAASCRKPSKIVKRTAEDSPENSPQPSDGADTNPLFTVKADSLGFRVLEKVFIEPDSCVPMEFNVTGGDQEKYIASAPEDLEVKPQFSSSTAEFFTDEKCENRTSSIPVPKDSDVGLFYLKEKTLGEWKLQLVTQKGPPFKSPELSFNVAKGDSLKFELIPSRSFILENCEPVILSLKAKEDKEIFSAKPFKVKVSATVGSAKIWTSTNCSGDPTESVEVPARNPSITLFLRATSSGPLSIRGEPAPETGYQRTEIAVKVDPKAS